MSAGPSLAGTIAGGIRRLLAARRLAGGALAVWLLASLATGLPLALAAGDATARLPDGSAALAAPGGAVALDALVRGRESLGLPVSLLAGCAVTWLLVVEPFLRGGLLCGVLDCHARCRRRRGLAARGARHFVPMLLLKPAVWSIAAVLAAGLLAAGVPAVLAIPSLLVAGGIVQDVASAALVARRRVRDAAGLFSAVWRGRPVLLLAGGVAARVLSAAPLLVQAAMICSDSAVTADPIRPVLLLLLPAVAICVRIAWLGVIGDVVAGREG